MKMNQVLTDIIQTVTKWKTEIKETKWAQLNTSTKYERLIIYLYCILFVILDLQYYFLFDKKNSTLSFEKNLSCKLLYSRWTYYY